MIWPEGLRRRVLKNGVYAEKLEGKKFTGLIAFQAQNRLDLYFDGNYWFLPEGIIFGAYAKNAKRRKIK